MNKIVIVGGGIVGVSTAYQIAEKFPESQITLIEKESELAAHQTGHNSGVIHSGVYYKPGSLKAQNCLNGYKMMLAFCNEYNIDYDLCGKIIVATEEHEKPTLHMLFERGEQNGLTGLRLI